MSCDSFVRVVAHLCCCDHPYGVFAILKKSDILMGTALFVIDVQQKFKQLQWIMSYHVPGTLVFPPSSLCYTGEETRRLLFV